MPLPRRLPRLTLYTGGKECGLCEVAKVELAKVRQTHPFEIKLWNIRDPPADATPEDVKHWRRMYQYDIPVLHLDGKRVAKHRIEAPQLQRILEEWQAANAAGDEAGGGSREAHSNASEPKE